MTPSEDYWLLSLKMINTKVLIKILAKQIQKHITDYTHGQIGIYLSNCSIDNNQSMKCIGLIEWGEKCIIISIVED